ncbi:universal stress protein [Streptomyces sp. NPDC059575]|uniref:universal stress protein n=1 Tax=Streptomyces sp. NPDC059575 TaxID=3346872 RepID=UPI00369C02DD
MSPTPMFTAATRETEEAPRLPRFVVGFDGSYAARAALRWAATQAREQRAVLDIVTVWTEGTADDRLDLARDRLGTALTTLIRDRNAPAASSPPH